MDKTHNIKEMLDVTPDLKLLLGNKSKYKNNEQNKVTDCQSVGHEQKRPTQQQFERL